MKVAIQSPADGTRITVNQVPLQVSFSGFQPSCDLAGTANVQGTGHYHVEIDKSLVDMFCVASTTISMQNVKTGTHTITVLPALNDHAEVEQNAKSVTISYEPTQPLPEIAAAQAGTPSIKIVSPKAGATLSGNFDVWVQVSNFNVSCDLEGKPDVAGYGHWHVNVDDAADELRQRPPPVCQGHDGRPPHTDRLAGRQPARPDQPDDRGPGGGEYCSLTAGGSGRRR